MDEIIRATARNNEVLVLACTSTDTVQTAVYNHHAGDVAAAALGRALSIGAMMGTLMKNDTDRMTLTIKGGGPIGRIVVTAKPNGEVKGYVDHPSIVLPLKANGKLDVASAVGTNGTVRVIRDTGLKEPYIGEVEIQTGEIGEDMAYYFGTSEQIPSVVGLGVLVTGNNTVEVSGGFLIQLLPFAKEETISYIEDRLTKIKSVTDLLMDNYSAEALISAFFENDYKVMQKTPLAFNCDCSKERLERVMISLGKDELNDIIAENKPVDIQCSFCKSNYRFEIDEIRKLLK